jgi:hypothetical protein
LRAYTDAQTEYHAGLRDGERLAMDWHRRNDSAWTLAFQRIAHGLGRMSQAAPMTEVQQ